MLVLLLLALPLEAGCIVLSRWKNLQQFVPGYIIVTLVMSIFYLVSCWWVRKKQRAGGWTTGAIVLAGLVFRLTLAPLYPSLTEDPYRYRWQGKLQAAGGNPYTEKPDDPRWAGLRDSTWSRVNRKDLPSPYGPLLEWTFRITYRAVSWIESHEFHQVRLFKIPYALFDLATAFLLARWGGSVALLTYFWSPLVALEFWASGHNDSMLLFFLVAALWAASERRWIWAFGALWLAALTKFWPVLLFPLFLRSGGRWKHALGWAPLAALVCYPYLGGLPEVRQMLAGFLGGWRNNASLFNFVYAWADGDFERAKPVVAVAVALLVVIVTWLRPPLLQGALWMTAGLLFLSANCFPWYLTWIVPFLAFEPVAALLLWTALVPLAYHVLIRYSADCQWLEDPFYLYLEYVPVYGMLLARRAVSSYRKTHPK